MNYDNLIKKLSAGTWEEKIKSAGALLVADKKVDEKLLMALTDENDDIRYWALKILGEKYPQKYNFYAESMLEDTAWFVRCQAVSILMDSDYEKYIKKIKKMLKTETEEEALDFIKEKIKS
ncbi:MAG: HEAT repeat domain-containing protein [Candidatus Muiribacteriota bacterium]